MIIVNPSLKVQEALGLDSRDLKWQQTCHSTTCTHASHDAGFEYVDVSSVPEGMLYEQAGSVHSHPITWHRDELSEEDRYECRLLSSPKGNGKIAA